MLKGLSLDRAWRISVGEHKPSRSAQQNRYLWGVIYKTILDAGHLQGWDTDDLHEYLLGEWSGCRVLKDLAASACVRGSAPVRSPKRNSLLTSISFNARWPS